jgi:hypothetical protein
MARLIVSNPDYDSVNGLAAGAIVFGLVSLAVCWWFPFGPILGAVGVAMGIAAWTIGTDREQSAVGLIVAAIGAGTGMLLAWDYWRRMVGL